MYIKQVFASSFLTKTRNWFFLAVTSISEFLENNITLDLSQDDPFLDGKYADIHSYPHMYL